MDRSKIDNLAVAMELFAEALEACSDEHTTILIDFSIDFSESDLDDVYVSQDVNDVMDEIEDGLKDGED